MRLGKLQKKWIKLLESDKFSQCTGKLKDKDGYCCLGLANEKFNLGETDIHVLHDTYEQLGLKDAGGGFWDENENPVKIDGKGDLAAMNDEGCSFKEIAKFIKENSDLLFSKTV